MATKKMNQQKEKIDSISFNKLILLRKIVAPILLLGLFIFVYQYAFDTKLNINGDNASYYLLGKSIHTGNGYSLYNDVFLKPQNHFPPGYPMLIAGFMSFSDSFIFLKIINGLFYLGSILLMFYFFQKFKVSWQISLVTVIFILFNYNMTTYSVRMMSEIPFLFFTLLSLWLLQKMKLKEAFLRDKYFWLCLVSLSFAFHIRTAGIALLGGITFYLLLEKQWKIAGATLGGFILLALPWFLRGKLMGLSSGYQSQLIKINPYQPELGNAGFGDFMTRFGENFVRYVSKEIPNGILPFRDTSYTIEAEAIDWGIGIFLILLIILGISLLPKLRSLIIGYLGGSFLILMFWPSIWKGTRFITPLLPFLIFLIVFILSILINKLLQKTKFQSQWIPLLLLPFLLAFTQDYKKSGKGEDYGHFPFERLKLEAQIPYSLGWQNYIKIAEYAKENTQMMDIIACRKPQIFHIFSDRFTCYYPYEPDPQKMFDELKKRKVKYIIVEQLGFSSSNQYLAPLINNYGLYFKEILHLQNPDTYLFELLPPS